MSEEEIINYINQTLKLNEKTPLVGLNNIILKENAVKGLLDLYNKEKEKNEKLLNEKAEVKISVSADNQIRKLQKEVEQEKEKNIKLDEKFRYVVPDDMIKELYISKNKIRKIKKELNKRIHLRDDDTYNKFKYLTIGEAILIERFIEKELLN